MLEELIVSNLGVLEHGDILFGPEMTALTGETGAGKTLVVEAISLLLGDRADTQYIRTGADEARVDGRFRHGDDEVVLTRVLLRSGRSRAYINGKPVSVQQLHERGVQLVDLHGQHAHQSLVSASAQREALDAFGGVNLAELHRARALVALLRDEQAGLGGDQRAREREMDMLRFQLGEIDAARLERVDEDDCLREEEELLGDAVAHLDAARVAIEVLGGDGGAGDAVGEALRALGTRLPFLSVTERLRAVSAELRDIGGDLRVVTEGLDPDPNRLDVIRLRRAKLRELQRKYGESIEAILHFAGDARSRLTENERREHRAGTLDEEILRAERSLRVAFAHVVAERKTCGASLAAAIETRLSDLAMADAKVAIDIDDVLPATGDGSVVFLLAANPGSDAAPLSRVASGGELARVMLALRLALLEGRSLVSGDPPDTLLFDEVDAGIGGTAAVAVGRALSSMAVGRQVLVVTHLPQVAACATNHLRVQKLVADHKTRTEVLTLQPEERIAELARMLAGTDSVTARTHAEELLAEAKAFAALVAGAGERSPDTTKPTNSSNLKKPSKKTRLQPGPTKTRA